jgi:NAD(P)-dependent dehydrogenase (short-subunit alcohol dehydrogenase family)
MAYTEGMLRDGALENRTIIVTGGGTGLGKSMATYFLRLGANVVICSRKAEVLEKTASELRQETGGDIIFAECDVRKTEQIENVIAKAIEAFGRVDGLVNNSAGNFISPTERLSYKAVDTVVDIVLRGTYYFTLALGKYGSRTISKELCSILSLPTPPQARDGWCRPPWPRLVC